MMPLRETVIARSSRLTVLLAVACVGCACSPGDAEAIASPVTLQQTQQAPGPVDATPQESVSLAFDLPADYSKRAADGGFAISGFQVGLFPPKSTGAPLRTVDVSRDSVTVEGNTARVTIRPGGLPDGDNVVVLRLRAVSRGQAGSWSEPIGPITVPASAAAAKRGGGGSRGRKKEPSELTVAGLEAHPALKKALDGLVGPGCQHAEAIAIFRDAQNLAMAAALTKRQTLNFADLCRTVKGPPRVSLRVAIRQLQPSANARQVVREARPDAQKLLTATKNQ